MERNTRIEEELFPFYVLDALTDEERQEVDAYVAANREARERLAELALAAADLSTAAPPIAPSPAVKAGLMARIEAESRATATAPVAAPRPAGRGQRPPAAPRRSWWNVFAPALAGAAVLVMVVSAVAMWRYARQIDELQTQLAALEETSQALQSQIGALEGENQTLRRELSVREELLAQFEQPGAVTVAIGDITGRNPDAVAALTIRPADNTGTLRVANLPPLAVGTVYQAWLIAGETPLSAGTFTVDESGAATLTVAGDLPPQIDAVGISLEPEGGSDTPTPGNILLLGTTS